MRRKPLPILMIAAAVAYGCGPGTTQDRSSESTVNPLSDSAPLQLDGHYLRSSDGSPFLFIGDMAWLLFANNLDEDAIDAYFADRASKGFNVIWGQLVITWNGYDGTNPRIGAFPIDNWSSGSTTAPLNETYFEWVDRLLDLAAAHGLYLGLIPGTYAEDGFNTDSAYDFGRRLGERYRDRSNIIWITGGDVYWDLNIHEAAAEGLRSMDSNHLVAFHPWGSLSTSSMSVDPWVDFSLFQVGISGGHRMLDESYRFASEGFASGKPVVNIEGATEGICADPGYYCEPARVIRKDLYWTLFAGGAGYGYAADSVYRFGLGGADDFWNAIDYEASFQLKHAKNLLLSRRGFFDRVPDQGIVGGAGIDQAVALRAGDGSHAFAYLANGGSVSVNLASLNGETVDASWFDPRTGSSTAAGSYPGGSSQTLTAPSGDDWVLVLDVPCGSREPQPSDVCANPNAPGAPTNLTIR